MAIANAAIECDSALFAIDKNKKKPQQPQQRILNPRPPPMNNPFPQQWRPPANNPVPAAPRDPHAMEVDAMTRRPPGPLTPEERAHRYNNQLCLVCGSATHFRDSCPTAARRAQQIARAGLVPTADPAPIKLIDLYLSISSLNPIKEENLILPASVKFGSTAFAKTVFIDSGAYGVFIHGDLVNLYKIPCSP